jgi:hypothetical protein|tara:strand:+ start:1105 stop:1326 length:222 start_codon:yes stop_codon:yes gene_type:complete
MGKLKDLLIDFEQDVPSAIEGAESFPEFVKNMIDINVIYELSMWDEDLREMWDRHVNEAPLGKFPTKGILGRY